MTTTETPPPADPVELVAWDKDTDLATLRLPGNTVSAVMDILGTVANTWGLQDETAIGHPYEYVEYLSTQFDAVLRVILKHMDGRPMPQRHRSPPADLVALDYDLRPVELVAWDKDTDLATLRLPGNTVSAVMDILGTAANTWGLQDETAIGHPQEYVWALSRQFGDALRLILKRDATKR
jgi:hypothetical protein